MRSLAAAILTLALSFASARPVDNTVESRAASTSQAISSAVPIATKYGSSLNSIVNDILTDPVLALQPYSTNGKDVKYDIPQHMESAIGTAVQGITQLPSLLTSSNPTAVLIKDYSPLVTVVARSLEATLIDTKLLSIDVVGPAIPGYANYITQFDNDIHQYVAEWNTKFKGFSTALANQIGANTPLGQAIKTLGGNAFVVIFDHQD